MEVRSSTEMGSPGASHLGTGDHGPKTDRSRPRSVPVNALVFTNIASTHEWSLTGSDRRTRFASRFCPRRLSPVVQVVQLESPLERLSDCRTVPYLRFFLVRNEEAGGSNPLSSTIFSRSGPET